MANKKVKVRFAPSPTGFMHIGSVRTALYDYLLAKQTKGEFYLRIEDTDQERLVPASVDGIKEALKWYGLNWDGKIMVQSQRLNKYQAAIEQLLAEGKAYYCFCPKARLEKVRQEQAAKKQAPGYDRHCRYLSEAERDKALKSGDNYVVRLKAPEEGKIKFKDLVRGEVEFDLATVIDPILLKSDGFPTYHLANIIDDHEMGITHVIRSEEWLPSVPIHLLLYQAFNWPAPEFAHLPMILAKDKSKLSKRHGAMSALEYKELGYLPEAVLNYLALLGWNPGDEREIFTLKELIKEFDIHKIHKAGAVFDQEKLDWLNGYYIRQLSPAELVKLAKPYLKVKDDDDKLITKALLSVQERMKKLTDAAELTEFYFKLPDYDKSLLLWKKQKIEDLKAILPEIKEKLAKLSEKSWEKAQIEAILAQIVENRGITNGEVYWPFRALLSGLERSSGPGEVAEVLGKKEALIRLDQAIAKIAG
ncbi:MAG: glutamate--tRNA ligase [bacterium]